MNKNYIMGKKIKDAREKKRLNQKDFAELLKVSQASVSKYESGENIPRMNKLREIASILELPLTYFIDESEEGKKDAPESVTHRERKKEILQVIQEFWGKTDTQGKKNALLNEPLLRFCTARIENGFYTTTRQLQIIRMLELIEEMNSMEE